MLKVVTLFMTYLIKYVFQKKTDNGILNVFNIITDINQSKILTKHISCESKCKFDGKNITQINAGITINLHVIVQNIMHVKKKKMILGILLHVVVKIENI